MLAETSKTQSSAPGRRPFDLKQIRADFPILSQSMNGKPLVYLDNAATTQKPQSVIDSLANYYKTLNSNIHRGVYRLSQDATEAHEAARAKVRAFLNAPESSEVIFTSGATASLNLVAQTWGRSILKPGDEIIISHMEHHSNIVPWQMICQATGAKLRVIPINDDGELLMDEYANMLNGRTRIVSVVHLSNSLGTLNPIRQIIQLARQVGAVTIVDGAQSSSHIPIDVQQLGCDFFVCSGHKLYGPTGIGVLWGNRQLLDAMPPYQGGGDMISSVSFDKTTWNELPYKFEAGTPHIEGSIGLGAAIDYIRSFNFDDILRHEEDVFQYAQSKISAIPGIRIIGNARHKTASVAFVVQGMSAQDVGMRLDMEGIAVRTGHHCTQPVMDRFGIPSTARASFAMYSSRSDIDALVEQLEKIAKYAIGHHAVAMEHREQSSQQIDYPGKKGDTIQAVADDMLETFQFLEDWPQRYQFLIELGENTPAMPSRFKIEANRVHGCQSTVYLAIRQKPNEEQTIEFFVDSDADIVRGLATMLQQLFSGQKAKDILDFNVQDFFGKIGLEAHLSMTRRNGLHGMVQRIQSFAREALTRTQSRVE